jgi:hypothetical protein
MDASRFGAAGCFAFGGTIGAREQMLTTVLAPPVEYRPEWPRQHKVVAAKKLFCIADSSGVCNPGSILKLINVLAVAGNVDEAEELIDFVYKYYDADAENRMSLIEAMFSDETGGGAGLI